MARSQTSEGVHFQEAWAGSCLATALVPNERLGAVLWLWVFTSECLMFLHHLSATTVPFPFMCVPKVAAIRCHAHALAFRRRLSPWHHCTVACSHWLCTGLRNHRCRGWECIVYRNTLFSTSLKGHSVFSLRSAIRSSLLHLPRTIGSINLGDNSKISIYVLPASVA